MIHTNLISVTLNRLHVSRSLLQTLLVLGTIFVGGVFRFFDLGGESYWVDEIIMVRLASNNFASIVAEISDTARPPMYVMAVHFWIELFGTSEVATRALSALFGTGSLVAMYLVGRELFNKQVALISLFLMAVSGYQIFYAQDLRYYSLFLLFTLLSFLFFVRLLKRQSYRNALFYIITTVLMFYTHTYGVFVMATQGLFLMIMGLKAWQLTARGGMCQMLVAVAVAPAFMRTLGMVEQSEGPMDWLRMPRFQEPVISLYRYVFGYDARLMPGEVAFALGFFSVSMLAFVHWKGLPRWLHAAQRLPGAIGKQLSQRRALLLTSVWLLCPLLLPFGLSFVLGPMYLDRYSIAAAPALYLLLAVGIMSIRNVFPRVITLGTCAILMTPGIYGYYTQDVKEQWSEVADYLEAHEASGDVIVFTRSLNGIIPASLNWYYQGDLPSCVMVDQEAGADLAIYRDLQRCIYASERFWLVERHWSTPYTHYVTTEFLEKYQTTLTKLDEQHFTRVTVYLFQTPRFNAHLAQARK